MGPRFDATGTESDRKCGGHVFFGWKPLTSGKKGSWAQETGSHVFWNGTPLTSGKKGSWAQDGAKSLEERGLKVQSPIGATGVSIKG